MKLLEIVFVGLCYLPFLILPFGLLFWYAYSAKRDEADESNDSEFNTYNKRPLTPLS